MGYIGTGAFSITNDFRETAGVYIPVSVAARGNVIRMQEQANRWASKLGRSTIVASGTVGPDTVALVNAALKTNYVAMQVAMLCSELADKLASSYNAKYGAGAQVTSTLTSAGKSLLDKIWSAVKPGSSAPASPGLPATVPSGGGSLLGGSTGLILVGGAVAAALYLRKKSKRKSK